MSDLTLQAGDAALLASQCEQQKAEIVRLLHDDLAQKLTVVNMELTLLQQDLAAAEPPSPAAVEAKLAELGELVKSASVSVRSITAALRPRTLDAFGFVAAMESLASKLQARLKAECRFQCREAAIDIDAAHAIHLLRVCESFVAVLEKPVEVELSLIGRTVEIRFTGRALPDMPADAMARLRAFGGSARVARGTTIVHFPLSWQPGALPAA